MRCNVVDKIKVGDVFGTNCSGDVEVIDYIHCNNIVVRFSDGSTKSVASGNLRAGKVNNKNAFPIGRSVMGDVIVGNTYTSNNYGKFKVVSFLGGVKFSIQFENTGSTYEARAQQIRRGDVYDPLARTKCGVGYFGIGNYNSKEHKQAYIAWNAMLTRAYSTEYKIRFPTYNDVTVCEEWHNFQNFAEWCYSQKNFGKDGWVLEKDILVRGNKIYSPEFCRFVHYKINALIVKCDARRGNLPIGVSWCSTNNIYAAHANRDGKTVFCGYFHDPIKAFHAYKKQKELIIKEVTNRYKDELDIEVYDAMVNYEVLITD